MACSFSSRSLVTCLAVILTFDTCRAWRGLNVNRNPQLGEKVVTGNASLTFADVTVMTCAQLCSSRMTCSFFTYNAAQRECVFCNLCSTASLTDTPGYQVFVLDTGHVDVSYDQTKVCHSSSMTSDNCWRQGGQDLLSHVSAGPAGVWGINHEDEACYRLGTYQDLSDVGPSWQTVSSYLIQLDVGTDIFWGTNGDDGLYRNVGMPSSDPTAVVWEYMGSGYTWASVSPGGSVWVVDTVGQLLHYRNSSNAQPVVHDVAILDVMSTDVQRVDAGQAGVWALTTDGLLVYRHGTYGDNGSTGTDWRSVEGTFVSVSSGKNVVVVVDTAGHVWVRGGLGPDTPAGLAWLRYPGYMTQVDVYQTDQGLAMWGVDFDDISYFSFISA